MRGESSEFRWKDLGRKNKGGWSEKEKDKKEMRRGNEVDGIKKEGW